MSKKYRRIVADICLYGNRFCGAGWGAKVGPQLLGDCDPKAGQTFTVAIWTACDAVAAYLGEDARASDRVRVFDAGGERMAVLPLSGSGYYGSIEWQAAPVYTISAAAIESAAVRS